MCLFRAHRTFDKMVARIFLWLYAWCLLQSWGLSCPTSMMSLATIISPKNTTASLLGQPILWALGNAVIWRHGAAAILLRCGLLHIALHGALNTVRPIWSSRSVKSLASRICWFYGRRKALCSPSLVCCRSNCRYETFSRDLAGQLDFHLPNDHY